MGMRSGTDAAEAVGPNDPFLLTSRWYEGSVCEYDGGMYPGAKVGGTKEDDPAELAGTQDEPPAAAGGSGARAGAYPVAAAAGDAPS